MDKPIFQSGHGQVLVWRRTCEKWSFTETPRKAAQQTSGVTVELPEFLLRAIHARVEEANANDPRDQEVDSTTLSKWLLVRK